MHLGRAEVFDVPLTAVWWARVTETLCLLALTMLSLTKGAPVEAADWVDCASTCGASAATGGGHLQEAPSSSRGRSVSKAMWRSLADSACQQSTGIIMCPEGAHSASITRTLLASCAEFVQLLQAAV